MGPKNPSYDRGIREDIIVLVGKEPLRVLNIGCGVGVTGERLKERGIKEVGGGELN